MLSEVVVAPIDDVSLSEALPAIHRAGLGHNARVVRAARADVTAQLRRAGIPTANGPARVLASDCLLVVNAAARSPLAASIALRHGATSAWIVSPNGYWRSHEEGPSASAAPAQPAEPDALPVPPGNVPAIEEAGNQPG